MNKLLGCVYVLREIALQKCNAHLAFLYHAPYRKQYNTLGGAYELARAYGYWIISNYKSYKELMYIKQCHPGFIEKIRIEEEFYITRIHVRLDTINWKCFVLEALKDDEGRIMTTIGGSLEHFRALYAIAMHIIKYGVVPPFENVHVQTLQPRLNQWKAFGLTLNKK